MRGDLVQCEDMKRRSGFTLLEVLVTVAIIGIVMVLITTTLPSTQDSQAVLRAEQEVKALAREAQQRALNEERDEDCLAEVGEDTAVQRLCSDVGVHVVSGEVVLFADTIDDDRYGEGDFMLARRVLPSAVTVHGATSFVWQVVPPTITLFVDGGAVERGELTLAAGKVTTTIRVSAYGGAGQVEQGLGE